MARLRHTAQFGLLALGLVCAGCPQAPKEAPPPPESLEVASAAPRALGALAAGTEGAPAGVRTPSATGPDEADPDDEGEDAGVPGPDAAIEAPEDIPL
jgi:hypothetical protein